MPNLATVDWLCSQPQGESMDDNERKQRPAPEVKQDALEEFEARSVRLARKLNLLMDALEAEGRRVSFSDIQKAVAADGIQLHRSRWGYMTSGTGHNTTDDRLLVSLAKFFGVNPRYLIMDTEELPERVEAQMDLLHAMRVNKVRNFAARQLADVDPETLRRITELLSNKKSNPHDDA